MGKAIELTDEQVAALCPCPDPSDLVMVRSRDAGVFFGEPVTIDLESAVVTLKNARRVWQWQGAATLSTLATTGTAKPKECRIPAPTSGEHVILGVCEIIPVTAEAAKSLRAVPAWKQP